MVIRTEGVVFPQQIEGNFAVVQLQIPDETSVGPIEKELTIDWKDFF